MESLNIKKLKTESKGNKFQKQKQLLKIGNLLRYAEICVLLVLISRVSLQQLPLALKNSTEYLRSFTISPLLVFLVGNIIIITLFAQSGQFSSPSSTNIGSDSESEPDDLYLEFLQNSTTNNIMYQNLQSADRKRLSVKDNGCKIKLQESEKQSISIKGENRRKTEEKKRMKVKRDSEVKEYRRCESEVVMLVKGGVESEKVSPRQLVVQQLQRCESEKNRGRSEENDEMSNDEFRRTVEAFISRQQRLRLQELYENNSVVV